MKGRQIEMQGITCMVAMGLSYLKEAETIYFQIDKSSLSGPHQVNGKS